MRGSADDNDAERGGERDEGAERAAAVRVEAAAVDYGAAAAESELFDSRNGGESEEEEWMGKRRRVEELRKQFAADLQMLFDTYDSEIRKECEQIREMEERRRT